MLLLSDLHLHSTASDGQHAPEVLVDLAARAGMRVVALTDHDSIDGVAQARDAARRQGMAFLPGAEMSTEGEREVDILGYGLDENSLRWRRFFAELQAERRERILRIVALLQGMGYRLDVAQIDAMAARNPSRAHVARALVASGAIGSLHQAFERLLSPGRPAYVPRPLRTVGETARALREAGAVPVLAHPGRLRMQEETLLAAVTAWQAQGLMGLEAHHPAHTPTQARRYDAFARARGLLVTGGSDFHGCDVRPSRIGDGMAHWRDREADVRALWARVPHTEGQLEQDTTAHPPLAAGENRPHGR